MSTGFHIARAAEYTTAKSSGFFRPDQVRKKVGRAAAINTAAMTNAAVRRIKVGDRFAPRLHRDRIDCWHHFSSSEVICFPSSLSRQIKFGSRGRIRRCLPLYFVELKQLTPQ